MSRCCSILGTPFESSRSRTFFLRIVCVPDSLPTGSLHTRQVSSHGLHSEIVLRLLVQPLYFASAPLVGLLETSWNRSIHHVLGHPWYIGFGSVSVGCSSASGSIGAGPRRGLGEVELCCGSCIEGLVYRLCISICLLIESSSGWWVAVQEKSFAHLSVSWASKTLRFVWSRRVRTLTKQPRSSFLARNIDMVGDRGWGVDDEAVGRCCDHVEPNSRWVCIAEK